MSDSTRVHHSAEVKVEYLKKHLVDGEKVSVICDDLGIHPNRFYEWKSKFFNEGTIVFKNNKEMKKLEQQVSDLSAKSLHKDTIVSELITELIGLKKKPGVL